jgi:hypothetical protein
MSNSGLTKNWQELTDKGTTAVREMVLDMARSLFNGFLHDVHDRLIDYSQRPDEDQKSFDFLHARSRISAKHNEISRVFLKELEHYFDRLSAQDLSSPEDIEGDADGGLALLDHDALEENIALAAIRKRAETDYLEPLWALGQRMSLLYGGKTISENQLPLAPGRFCSAIKRALAVADIPLSAKLVICKLFDRQLVSQLGVVYGKANDILKDLGVLPNLNYQVEKSKSADSARFTGAALRKSQQAQHAGIPMPATPVVGQPLSLPPQDLPPQEYQHQLVNSIQFLHQRLLAKAPSNEVAKPGQPLQYSGHQLVEAAVQLQQLDQVMAAEILSATQEIKPLDIAKARRRLVSQLKEITDSKEVPPLSGDDTRAIDLVGMLFEYVLNDEHLPDCVKALLSYLHTPFLKLAFSEADFFRQQEHPSRLLLNALADAGARWVSNDGSSQFDMLEQIRQTVRTVLDEDEVEAKVFAGLLMTFNSAVQKVELRVQLLEKRAMEKARGEDKLCEVKQRVNREIHQRIAEKDIPSAILLFLLQPWSDYLSFTLLRHGDKSDAWTHALALVDDMLWGLELSGSEGEWSRWRQHYPWMESIIQQGFDTTGYETGKALKLKRSIDHIYQLREKNLKPETASKEIRNKLVHMAEMKAGEKVDLSRMSEKEQSIIEKLRLMEFGAWFEHRDGKREKVAWFNPSTLHFLFVDQSGKRSGMRTGEELAQAMVAGEVRMISGSTKPLVERTMDSIFSELNDQVQAQPQGERHAQ